MQKTKDTQKRKFRTNPLAKLMPTTVNKALRRFGFAQTSIISNWPTIVGVELADYTSPTKLTFKKGTRDNGTLHVMVDGAEALRFQHTMPLIIEKINMYHGFKLVGHIALSQGPVASRREGAKKAKNKPLPTLETSEQTNLDQLLGETKSEALKDALGKLGRRILGDKNN